MVNLTEQRESNICGKASFLICRVIVPVSRQYQKICLRNKTIIEPKHVLESPLIPACNNY